MTAADDNISVPDTCAVNVCPAASNSATFLWEWNGLFISINT